MQFAGGTETLRLTGRKRLLRQLAMTDFLQPLCSTALVRQEATDAPILSLAVGLANPGLADNQDGEQWKLTGASLLPSEAPSPAEATLPMRAPTLAVAPPPAKSSSLVEVLPPTSFPAPLAETMPQAAGEAVIPSPQATGTEAIYDFIQICTWPSSVVKLQWNIFDVALLVENDGEELE
ncbi:hypothetical protein F441_21809, partial [Phytophthora nicotianae CJ01A1]